jgi:hypothetical protein
MQAHQRIQLELSTISRAQEGSGTLCYAAGFKLRYFVRTHSPRSLLCSSKYAVLYYHITHNSLLLQSDVHGVHCNLDLVRGGLQCCQCRPCFGGVLGHVALEHMQLLVKKLATIIKFCAVDLYFACAGRSVKLFLSTLS